MPSRFSSPLTLTCLPKFICCDCSDLRAFPDAHDALGTSVEICEVEDERDKEAAKEGSRREKRNISQKSKAENSCGSKVARSRQ